MSPFAVTMICVGAVVLILIVLYFYYNNKEVALRMESEAQRESLKAIRDQVYKILVEQGNMSDDYKKQFNDIYPKIIAGRYSDSKDIVKMIVEDNPAIDNSLRNRVVTSIETQRTLFTNAERRMLDILRQRKTMIHQYPSKWFVRNKEEIPYAVLTSTDTRDAFDSGTDDFVLNTNK